MWYLLPADPRISGGESLWENFEEGQEWQHKILSPAPPHHSSSGGSNPDKEGQDEANGLEETEKVWHFAAQVEFSYFFFSEYKQLLIYMCAELIWLVNKNAAPLVNTTSEASISTHTSHMYIESKKTIKKHYISKHESISFTQDAWTALNVAAFLAVTANLIDEDFKLCDLTISVPQVEAARSLLNCSFKNTLKKYLAVNCLHTKTANNASMNSKMACKLELQIPNFDSATHILGGVAHVINIAAKGHINWINITLLFSTPKRVGINAQTINKQLHRLCTWVCFSPQQCERFAKAVDSFQPDLYAKDIRCLEIDVTTRWNSTYEMFWRALMLKKSFPTLNNALPVYIVLLEHLHMACRGLYYQAQLIQPAELMIKKIDEYLQDAVKKPVYIATMILDPRFKNLFWKTHQDFIKEHYHLLVKEIIQIFETIGQEFYNNIVSKNQDKDALAGKSAAASAPKSHSFFASKTLPNLALMAHQYLCIPATSASSERVISKGHRIVPWQQYSLKPQAVKELLCLKDWFQTFDGPF
ncbi:uncharacterized protein VP01_2116g1 [Puccinia sorghi]|uniref:HAT C-terminal dimerisation domain-containing protein n=1 Tax=Puccinia sorghi TaxID=27349 RepID=A0A0L6VAM2_9BASI|nr:uncharacterized protein VP01_2116g1 [Puccinia sorghi]